MELVKNIDKIKSPYRNAVITIGNFDGVHKGHQKLLHRVKQKADAINGTAIAVTFEPHSLKVLKKDIIPIIKQVRIPTKAAIIFIISISL